jgi:hypothetical protein
MKIGSSNTAASNESLNIEALNLGHCGTHLSCMQATVPDAVLRLEALQKKPVHRDHLKPMPKLSK